MKTSRKNRLRILLNLFTIILSRQVLKKRGIYVGAEERGRTKVQAPVVQTLDSAIHRINHYPADKYYGNQLRYPLDSDLSSG